MKEFTYGVREFQAHVSEAIRAIQAGNRVVVVSRNRPVAEMVLPRKSARKMTSEERKLERLYESGKLSRPLKSTPMPPIRGFPMPGLLEEFLANRR